MFFLFLKPHTFTSLKVFALIAIFLLPTAPLLASDESKGSHAIWIWKANPIADKNKADEIFDFCKKESIVTLYLFMQKFDDKSESFLENTAHFLKTSHEKGLKVHALQGHPSWANQKGHHWVIRWLTKMLQYNKSQPQESRFDGLSLDIEPYLLAKWHTKKKEIMEDFLLLLKKSRSLIDTYKDEGFSLGIALPVFFKNEEPFFSEMFHYIDYVALMDYFDNVKTIEHNARPFLDHADFFDRKVWIGLETQDLITLRQGNRMNTFFEEGYLAMKRSIADITQTFARHNGFGGIAYHYYKSLRELPKGPNKPVDNTRLITPEDAIVKIKAFKRDNPPTIDGALDDWTLAPYYLLNKAANVVFTQGPHPWKGPGDISVQIYSAWDENTLYFAFSVQDDFLIQTKTGADLWQDDHIELWLDADLAGDFTTADISEDDFQLGLSPGNFTDKAPEAHIWVPAANVSTQGDLLIAATKSPSGYILELAIPHGLLYNKFTTPMSQTRVIPRSPNESGDALRKIENIPQDEFRIFYAGYRLGISIEASDTDDPQRPQKCMLSTSINRKWGDPTTFGYLELVE